MDRKIEPELMLDEEQARAYAAADFEDAHSRFLLLFRETFPGEEVAGNVLDLGCGPGDIACRFARAFPRCVVHGVDGSEAMLRAGRELLGRYPGACNRVELLLGRLPDVRLPRSQYDAVISNSLLHHLHEPEVLWRAVKTFAAPQAPVFVMDLRRVASEAEVAYLVEKYSGAEPGILKRDFHNSLLAAFEPAEVKAQLVAAGLDRFAVTVASDRHLIVFGRAP